MHSINWLKKISKTLKNGLLEGESIRSTLLLTPKGTMKRTIKYGLISGSVGGAANVTPSVVVAPLGAAAAQVAESKATANARSNRPKYTTFASSIPPGRSLLASTSKNRVIVYSVNWRNGRRLTYHGVFNISKIKDLVIEKKGLIWHKAKLIFEDGSVLHFDLLTMHDYKKFFEIIKTQR